MLDEHVELLERALVEQQFDALARGQFAALVLGLDAALAAAQPRLVPPLLQPVENVLHKPLPCANRLQNAYHGGLSAVIGALILRQSLLTTRLMSEPATAAQLLQQGLFHHRQGDLAQAMERYVEVLRADPQNPDALYYVAVVACQEGQYRQGIDLARRAIDFGPPQARVHNLLGQALYREGERLEALKNFDRAIALDANFADAHGNRANILVDAGFADEALKSFDRALALNPASGPDWLNRGALLQELGRHDEALASFDKAIMCGPDVAEAHVNRGNALKDLGHLDAAGGRGGARRASTKRWRPTTRRSRSSRGSTRPISGAACSSCCAATGRPALPITNTARKSASRHSRRCPIRAGTAHCARANASCW